MNIKFTSKLPRNMGKKTGVEYRGAPLYYPCKSSVNLKLFLNKKFIWILKSTHIHVHKHIFVPVCAHTNTHPKIDKIPQKICEKLVTALPLEGGCGCPGRWPQGNLLAHRIKLDFVLDSICYFLSNLWIAQCNPFVYLL